MARRRKKRLPVDPVEVTIADLSHDGRGVARVEGKTVFIEGALTGERVKFLYVEKRRNYDVGVVDEIIEPSPLRVEPRCALFGICGGCSLQHMQPERQIEAKQEVLLENFERIGKVTPEAIIEPLTGPLWGYRGKARLGVRWVAK